MVASDFTSRRHVLGRLAGLSLLAMPLAACAAAEAPVVTVRTPSSDAGPELAALETRAGGRLGVSILMSSTGQTTGWRAGETFVMRSTMKLPVAGFVLREIDRGQVRLDQMLGVADADRSRLARDLGALQPGAQVSVESLLNVMLTNSNNPATDMLLGLIGGPAGFHERLSGLGDTVTRLDNPDRAFSAAGQESTTPQAMAATVSRMLDPAYLSEESRQRLQDWMVDTRTGTRRLRAGFDPAWVAGDKTGTGPGPDVVSRINDVAVVWFSPSDFVVVSGYYESPVRSGETRAEDEAVLAEAGRIAAQWIKATRN